ncbi:MAG: molybdopterin biosynthesis protein MoeA [Alphaproteobacteria bacterium]|nr:molybdopterin biosynthesis protein MoeA [Alphaproteobacteria bacterium]
MNKMSKVDKKIATVFDTKNLTAPDLPPRIIMDLRTDCNLKCPMCIVHGDPENEKLKGWLRRETDMDKVRKVLDEVMEAKPLFMPSLWSEPTLSKQFREYVTEVKKRGCSLAMNTNGLVMRRDMAEFFVEVELDAVAVSVDATKPETLKKVRGIDKLDKIHQAVELMLEVRGDAKLPRIGATITLQEANAGEEQEFVDYWSKKVDFVRTSWVFADGGFADINLEEERTPCPALYSTMAVHVDGNVSYCCLDGFGETSVGNVFEQPVRDVWNGEEMQKVRHYHETKQWDKVPFCKSCDRWASYEFEEEVRDGLLIRKSPEYTYYNRIDRLDNWEESLLGGTHKDPRESMAEHE